MAFDFGATEDLLWARDQLRRRFGRPGLHSPRTPIGQLVKSIISGRTRDQVSLGAYLRLIETFPEWSDITRASENVMEAVIGDVTFADVKAGYLKQALLALAAVRPDFDLMFLAELGVDKSLVWLERLPGVGRKVSASTLNFSTLNMPAFVIDTHILRIMRRFGFVREKADTVTAYGAAMRTMHDWNAADLAELHSLTKHLGQTICRPNGACCRDCPIRERCITAMRSVVTS